MKSPVLRVCVCVCVCVCVWTADPWATQVWTATVHVYTHMFFHCQYFSPTQSGVGWIPDGSAGLKETWMGGSDHKFYLDFNQSGGFAPLTTTLFKDQL